MKKYLINFLYVGVLCASLFGLNACNNKNGGGVSYKQMADSLHSIMDSDRTVYTRLIVNRLAIKEKVIKASEHWRDDKALVLPAQMFRYGSEMTRKKNQNFAYSLLSLWPINKQNKPRTAIEKKGLKFVTTHPGKNYYGEEKLGSQKYYTAIYPDTAIANACIACHNAHKDSPRHDFKMGEVMGGVVLRIKAN